MTGTISVAEVVILSDIKSVNFRRLHMLTLASLGTSLVKRLGRKDALIEVDLHKLSPFSLRSIKFVRLIPLRRSLQSKSFLMNHFLQTRSSHRHLLHH